MKIRNELEFDVPEDIELCESYGRPGEVKRCEACEKYPGFGEFGPWFRCKLFDCRLTFHAGYGVMKNEKCVRRVHDASNNL